MRYSYNGLSDKDRRVRTASMLAGISVPKGDYLADKRYQINKTDSDETKATKLREQAAFRKVREDEVHRVIAAMDARMNFCGVVFTKGEPVDEAMVSAALIDLGLDDAAGLKKLRGLTRLGVFTCIAEGGKAVEVEPEAEDPENAEGAERMEETEKPKRRPGRPRKDAEI